MNDETSQNNNCPAQEKWERDFNLFKLEYEQAAQRYENIYRAIWQIFQYMAFLSGGILTFASKSETNGLDFKIIISIALTPLLFWFLAIYIPMDQYGKNALINLQKIEERIEKTVNQKFNESCFWQLSHYTNFSGYSKPPWRVRNIIIVFGVTISVTWVFSILLTLRDNSIEYQNLIYFIDIVIFAVTIVLAIDNLLSKSKINHHDQQQNNQSSRQ
ncbi:MAG: hypothetical protein QNJ37_01605 [Crocosphaera sp.]|nr:hypothetical protein [Crocosphaera sp.]